jgi:tRNA-Thr(GGU) m(6)t(6)A37 methyltransferase TsaA
MKFEAIAHVKTCYGEKFGVPRQPGLVDEAWGELVFEPEFRNLDSVRGLEEFSHLWLVFVFHQATRKNKGGDWKPTVRPPRLGGNEKVGVFASRSPFRPNPLGLSCVKLECVDTNHPDGPILKLRGVDLVDGTPILDIKPYIPYSDSIQDAREGFARGAPPQSEVRWQDRVGEDLDAQARTLIENTLALDPRPAYRQEEKDRSYGCLINGLNITWQVKANEVVITSCHTA